MSDDNFQFLFVEQKEVFGDFTARERQHQGQLYCRGILQVCEGAVFGDTG